MDGPQSINPATQTADPEVIFRRRSARTRPAKPSQRRGMCASDRPMMSTARKNSGTGNHLDAVHENPSRHLARRVFDQLVESLFCVAPALTRLRPSGEGDVRQATPLASPVEDVESIRLAGVVPHSMPSRLLLFFCCVESSSCTQNTHHQCRNVCALGATCAAQMSGERKPPPLQHLNSTKKPSTDSTCLS